MEKISRTKAQEYILTTLKEFQKKIDSVKTKKYDLPWQGQYVAENTAYLNVISKLSGETGYFSQLDTQGIQNFFTIARNIAKTYNLETFGKIANCIVDEKGNYYISGGIFYIDARNTGITLSEIYESIFLNLNYAKNKEWYKTINSLLNIDNPDRINKEYTTNLQNNSIFELAMRKKFISDAYSQASSKNAREKAVSEGRTKLIHFDELHGTTITASSSDKNKQAEGLYGILSPKGKLNPEEIISFLNSIELPKLINPDYIQQCASTFLSEIKNDDSIIAIKRWVEIIKKMHLENLSRFELTDQEIVAVLMVAAEIKDSAPSLFVTLMWILGGGIGSIFTTFRTVENFLYTVFYKPNQLHNILGFTYAGKGKDYYFTEKDSIQSKFGFADLYDESDDLLGMDIDSYVITFPYLDKEYRVEFWKGEYGFHNAYGAEIGIYYRELADSLEKPYGKEYDNTFTLFDCVKRNDQFSLELQIYEPHNKPIISKTSDYEKDKKHFWNLAIRTSHANKNSISIIGYISHEDTDLINTMYNAIHDRIPNTIKAKDNHTIQISLKQGKNQ